MQFTAHTNAMVGNYADMKAAHLGHDEEKYNSNDTIDYAAAKYNTNTKHVEDFDEWYHEKYEEPILTYNAKQKRKDRKIESYDAYFEQKKNHGNRKNTELFSPNRLLLMGFSDKQNNDKLKSALMKQFGFTEEQYYQTMANGMDLAVERFNEHFDNMTIVENYTHVNEGYPHTHANLYAHGTDKDGKPFTDVNDALFEHYGRFKTDEQGEVLKNKKGNNVRKSRMVLWEEFRADVDENIIHKSMVEAIEATHGKKIKGIDFKRSGTEFVGQQHDALKQSKIAAAKHVANALNDRAAKLSAGEDNLKTRESDLVAREQSVDEDVERRVNMAVKPREDAVAKRETAVSSREVDVSKKEQQVAAQFEELKRQREEDEAERKEAERQKAENISERKKLSKWRDKLLNAQGNINKHNVVAEHVALGVLKGDQFKKLLYDDIRKNGLATQDPRHIANALTESMEQSKSKIAPRRLTGSAKIHADIEKDIGPDF